MLKKSLKKIISMSLIVGSLFTFAACGNKATTTNGNSSQSAAMQKIKGNKKLVIGTSAGFAPFEFHASVNGKDEIVGFDIEIAKEIAKDLGVELEIKDMKFDGLIAALDQGNIDIIVSGMTPTDERRKKVDFSNVYFTSKQSIVLRASDKDAIKSLDNLKGKKVGVQKGTVQEQIAAEQINGAKAVALNMIPDLMLQLKSNKIDAILAEEVVADANVQANPDLIVSSILISAEKYTGNAVAMKKGSSDLVESVNKTLNRLKADGSIDKFYSEASKLAKQQKQ